MKTDAACQEAPFSLISCGYRSKIQYEVEMKLSDALEEKQLDVRLRDKLLEQGKLTKKQVEDYLAKLDDSGSKAAYTEDERS